MKKNAHQRAKVNNLIEEKKQSIIEGEDEEASDEEAAEGAAAPAEAAQSRKRYELNMDPNYWRKKFLYPFALDPAPLRLEASK